MLGQSHKIILTMSRSRWPNCPNMCGTKYEVPKCVVPGLVGFPMWRPSMWCHEVP